MMQSATGNANGPTGPTTNPPATSGNAGMANRPKKDRLITRDVALVMLATFFFMTSNMIITPIIAGYAELMGAAGTMMGVIAGVMSFVSLFCRPVAGNLSDLVSKRLLVTVGTSLYIIAGIMYCLANSTGMLIAARVVNGLGFACGSVCLATWVSLLLPIRHMGAGMGLYGIVNALAIAVGPALGIRLQAVAGYHLTFVASLVLNVLTLIVVMLVRNGGNPARQAASRSRGDAGRHGIAHRFRLSNLVEPRAIPLTMVFMMFAIPYFANQSFIVDYISARHLTVSSDLFFVFYAAALLIMRITMKNLFDSKGFRFWLVICSIAMLAMLAFLTFMTNDWYLLGAGVAMAASYGLMSSVTQAQAVVIAGRERSGLANSTYYMGLDLGMALGPILAGVFYGHMPIGWFYPAFMLTMPIAWIIYLAFSHVIHPTAHADD
ncbi:MFS transporter [Bifidobacterium moukalabense]|uniref:MFS transporter n=1 Tax=Bifidobacterium moukalabense TaxID=1333651 RepID=UPI0010F65ED5|nr:MFS transporter [Bifidobacterium moukalabense]